MRRDAAPESDARFREVFQNAAYGMALLTPEGRILEVNHAVERKFGHARAEMVGTRLDDLVHPDDREAARALRAGVVEGPRSQGTAELRLRHRDGSYLWVRLGLSGSRRGGEAPPFLILVGADVSRQKESEEALRESEERYRAVVENLGEGLIITDLDDVVTYVNPRMEELTGYSRGELLGRVAHELLLPGEEHARARAELARRAEGIGSRYEVLHLLKDGTPKWFEVVAVPHRSPDGAIVGTMALVEDVTGRRQMEEQLRHEALHDALTGLPNRLLFHERLTHAAARAKRREEFRFAVLFLDLDRFKVVNDSLGHQAGDELLRVVARRLADCLRGEDTVARLGGDEFAILLEGIGGVDDASRVADRVQAEVSVPVTLGAYEAFTPASVGIALGGGGGASLPEHLLRNADMAMYRAKAAGGARYEVFDAEMYAEELQRLQLENDLRRAVERGEFRLCYQPVVALETGKLRGWEALVRWVHPERGTLMPEQFIQVAEETGMIVPLGEWVIREACRQLREWHDRFPGAGPLSVGVNLSPRQLSQPELVERVREALVENGLPGKALRLEITEGAFMDHAETPVGVLEGLQALEVRISLDDFGTGYSSLSYLLRFPVDVIKVDRSFVGRMTQDQRSAQLVATVLTLARTMGISAVAEGIETEEQLSLLRAMGCRYGQGFLFATPLTPQEVAERLSAAG